MTDGVTVPRPTTADESARDRAGADEARRWSAAHVSPREWGVVFDGLVFGAVLAVGVVAGVTDAWFIGRLLLAALAAS